MTERDEKILKHISLYKFSIRAVIENLFFDGKSCDDVVSRLLHERRVTATSVREISFYRLSLNEARKRGLDNNRLKQAPGSRATRRGLAVLWFCCMSGVRRHVIERKTLTKLFGRAPGLGVPHCWESAGDRHRLIHRLYVPGPTTPEDDTARSLRRDAEAAIADSQLAPLVLAKLYIFAVLVGNAEKRNRLSAVLQNGPELPVGFRIELFPEVEQLSSAIRVHKGRQGTHEAPTGQRQAANHN